MRRAAALIAAAFLASPAAGAAPATVRQYADLALSPGGDRIATVESDAAPDSPSRPHGRVVLRAAATGAVLQTIDPCAACTYSGLAFAPDGRLAFLARQQGTTRLMLAGRAAPLATIDGIAQSPRFSPDGRQIALLVTIGARKEAGATQAGVRQVGEIGEANDEQRIALVPAAGGVVRPISPPDRYVYEYDWTPDGAGFVATSARGNGDNNWWVAELDRIDAASGAVRLIAAPKLQMNQPRVSPDGRTVAFIGGLMSDFGSIGGDVYAVDIAGGVPRDLTPDYRGSFTSLLWGRAGLAGSALIADRVAIVPLDPGRGPAAPAWSASVAMAAGDAKFARSADGRAIAFAGQDYGHAPAIFAGPASAPRPLTHDNDGWPALVSARSISWQSGPYRVQGWLLAPAAAPRAERYPMVTIVHGGPAAASVPAFVWQGSNADLARAGYYLFLPNPRGSYGQGEAFTRANMRDFGGGDLKDILAGIDAVEREAPIDDARLGLMGGSYGGFMAMWANTQTHRFKAIVAGAGLSNWISYYGTNGIDQWMIPFFGKSAYEDPDAYWAVSAIRTIRSARTPTFIYVGERDIEVPPTQSVEYWHALREMNVPTSLVIYPGEGHGIRGPDNAIDVRKRTVAWFDRWLGKGR
ncbi:MAG: S9 family peptidase [Alphaproteobacteria bacterium]|nr:S9 family peptidase [Alphaproteobacteria bacterium]